MKDILIDPIWQFVGVILTLIALVVTYLGIVAQRRNKSLSYHHSFERPVFYLIEKKLKDRLRFMFDDRQVERLSTFNILFFNDGDLEITPDDYKEPITISFPSGIQVFGVSISETIPQNLTVDIQGDGGKYLIQPLLLNSGDEFNVQFLIENPDSEILVKPLINARISGVKSFGFKRYKGPIVTHRVSYSIFFRYRVHAFIYGVLGFVFTAAVFALFT